ncbi:MAG: carbohydrate binding family 9 domain-containing protein [Gemmatimonadetes bacterium]|nr:carbohydrate binding family 9 domain-containing protein [Gemmatimonadota bacterium]
MSTKVLRCSIILMACHVAAAAALRAQTSSELSEARSPTASADFPIDVEAAPRPVVHAARASGAIRVDGRVDEEAWKAAESLTTFIQSKPDAGYPASQRTVARILFDSEYLYISAVCYDSDPDGIIITSLERDYESLHSDAFGVAIDTFLDRRNSFMFFINPAGAVRDAQSFDDTRVRDLAWDGIIRVKTWVQEWGWSVEMAIPWTTLRFDPNRDEQRWGLNLYRRIRRRNEDAFWAPIDRRDKVYTMSRAGTLVGLGTLPAGRNLRFKPYVRAARKDLGSAADAGAGSDFDAGLDLKYGVTPGLTLDLTYRTDFSQVEVDEEQVNLTRFSLFFPEKREFFVENSGSFAFGDAVGGRYRTGTSLRDFTLFHSRRIGLEGGRAVPVLGGGRLTGRMGAFEGGILTMQTKETGATPAENFTVARLRRPLFSGAQVGAIFTNRQGMGGRDMAGGGAYNRSFGIDADAELLGKLYLQGYLAATDYPGAEGNTRAGRFLVAWRDWLVNASVMMKEIGDGFEPGIGFVRRGGIRNGYATFGLHPRPAVALVEEVNPYVEVDYITNLADVLETRTSALGFAVNFADGSVLSLEYSDRFERLFQDFRVRADAAVPRGTYHFDEGSVSYRSSAGRPLSGSVRLSQGGFFNGERTSVGLSGVWRPSHHLTLDLSADHNEVALPESRFTADVYGFRMHFATSARLITSAFVQYNRDTDEVVSNLRLNFIHAPLSDFFLVYTERRDVAGGGGVLERQLTAKVTKLFGL